MLKTIVPEMNTNNWADLPADILARILKHLDLKTDLTRLRGVCPSWRSALPLQQHYPSFRSHIQVPNLSDGLWCDRPLFLLESAFYYFSPINPCGEGSSDSGGWVARMGQIAPNKWRLLNPLSYYHNICDTKVIGGNEYLLTDPSIVGEINLLDCRVFILAKALTLVIDLDFNAKPLSNKVVGEWDLTSSNRPFSAILILLPFDHVAGLWSRRLLLLRPNDAQKQQNEWVEISEWSQEQNNQHNLDEHDIAYSNGIFYVFQVNGNRWRVRTINPSNKKLVLNPFASGVIIQTLSWVSLVPSKLNGCLYLVLSQSSGGKQWIYLLDEDDGPSVDESKMKITNKLGNEILFCLNYVSFSIQSSTLLNNEILQDKNCMAIFYMDGGFNKFIPNNSYLYSNLMLEGVKGFNLVKFPRFKENISLWLLTKKDINENSVLDFDVGKNRVLLLDVMAEKELVRVYTRRLFFPPPAWVKWRCPSLQNVDINLHDLIDESLSHEYYYYDSDSDMDSDFEEYYNFDMDSDFEEYYDFDYGSS